MYFYHFCIIIVLYFSVMSFLTILFSLALTEHKHVCLAYDKMDSLNSKWWKPFPSEDFPFCFCSFPLCAFSNVLIVPDIFFLLLHNKEADRRLLCSQMAHYLLINLTKASLPRSTESTRSAAPLPVITKHAFLICRPRVCKCISSSHSGKCQDGFEF